MNETFHVQGSDLVMKNKYILPLMDSIISYTPNYDHFLSVLENQHELTYPWILENYVDLIIRKDGSNPDVFEFLDFNKIWWTCPFVHVSRIHRDVFASGYFLGRRIFVL